MSDTKGVLVLRVAEHLSAEQHEQVAALLDPVAKAIGVPGMILGPGCELELQQGYGAELKRIGDLLEQLVKATQAPKFVYPNTHGGPGGPANPVMYA